MQPYLERLCGLDVHKKTVVACVRVPDEAGGRTQHVRTFGTMAADLLVLRDWTAEVVLAELGGDMRHFPTAAHLASCVGLCPGNHESAGTRMTGRIRPGNRWLHAALIESARIVIRAVPESAFAARYHRIARHPGHKKALVAVAHAMLVTIYYLLARHTEYLEAGAAYCDRHQAERLRRQAVRTLEHQGCRVSLEPAA